MKQAFDVVIKGGGLAGWAAAMTLGALGVSCLLLGDQGVDSIDEASGVDLRPISLNYASVEILKTLGVFVDLAQAGRPIDQVEVSQQARLGSLLFTAEDLAVPYLGYVVSYQALLSRLKSVALKRVDYVEIERLDEINVQDGSVLLRYQQGGEAHEVSASLLVAADGAGSGCRQQLGITATTQQSGKRAIVLQCALAGTAKANAYQRLTPYGTVALLPLHHTDAAVRVVWSCSAATWAECETWSDEQILVWLNQVFAGRVGAMVGVSRLAVWPLQQVVAQSTPSQHALLLGNARQTLYPLTAQGFNLVLRDVAALAQLWQAQPHGVGSAPWLQAYTAWREPDQQRVREWTYWLDRLFDLPYVGVSHARGLGLLGADMLPGVKWRLGRVLLGLAGRVPDLALGVALTESVK